MEVDAFGANPVAHGRTFLGRLRRALIADVPLLAITVAYTATIVFLSRTFGLPENVDLWGSMFLVLVHTAAYLLPAFAGYLSYLVVTHRRSLYDSDTWRELIRWFLNPAPTLTFLLVFVSLSVFVSAFSAFKGSIPTIHPFSWDVQFMEWDSWLHLGRHPWQILQPVLGWPLVTQLIDFSYYLWFPVLWLTIIWQTWHGARDSALRSQFLVAFSLCWILLGTVAAVLLSSAGPVYFSAVTGAPDPYAPLVEYLQVVNAQDSLRALITQDMLWSFYVDPGSTQAAGISAMPSMHISMAVLLTLLGFGVHRWLGWIYAAFAVLMFIGSVHLAWHYAIDGYVSVVGTLVIWWVSGVATGWWRRKFVHQTSSLLPNV